MIREGIPSLVYLRMGSMEKERSRWLYFLMSVGTIFIVLSPTEDGSAYHLILGLVLIGLSIMFLTKKKK